MAHPTRHGWALVAGGVAAIVCGRLFGVIELYVLGAASVALVGLGWLWALVRRPRVQLVRVPVPREVTAGENARVELRISADGPTPALELWEPVPGVGGAAMQLAPLRRGEEAVARYRLPTQRRGVITVGPAVATWRDAFGLAAATRRLADVSEVLVRPRSLDIHLPDASAASGSLSVALARRSMGRVDSGEFHSLRQYLPGDDMRRVHWRASARRDDLVVKRTQPEHTTSFAAYLDTDATLYEPAAFEMAVVVAASLVRAAEVAGFGLRFSTGAGFDADVSQPAEGEEAMRHLARIRPQASPAMPRRSAGDPEHLRVGVVITGRADAAHLVSLSRATGRADAALVVRCAAGGTVPPGWWVVDADDEETFLAGWRATCGSGTVTRSWVARSGASA